ncbi:DNA repair ATPase [Zooshikella harenae]|uniref:DNA repair ATPase n=1 Tax=Zooshikella harenae TaxID=2827238 RepID=A0ABS5Z933_9GAMM|nr:DNA repair ATPase [Zooshikella harenae]MBU2710557.1 DNA repair ATPase [Zooshikella harenae]
MSNNTEQVLEQAVHQEGTYEVLRKRLQQQASALNEKIAQLNEQRITAFGKTETSIINRVRARTENNCVARDIVRIGNQLLFGFNVFMGLKKEHSINDVFALYQLSEESSNELQITPIELKTSFLNEQKFLDDFKELYTYYKHAKLIQLRVTNNKLLAAFQIGQKVGDIRVFRWSLDNAIPSYIDNRGERDITLPATHDFEWIPTSRDNHVLGEHPHINILDKVFIETINGDLTIKIENNTTDGQGIYSEPVDDLHQSLDDAEVYYADLIDLILLKVKPYREESYRYLIFNTLLNTVTRIDELGSSCQQLPENHGIIYPGGYYLTTGEHKTFSTINTKNLVYKRTIKSPNGEDILYVYYEPIAGRFVLCAYNLITKTLNNPIEGHGYALYPDGKMIIFSDSGEEPTHIHPMQIWQTPFVSDEFASAQETATGLFATLGNAELVRAISDLYSISKAILQLQPSTQVYTSLINQCNTLFDSYYWLDQREAGELAPFVKEIVKNAELVLDEFEKVQHLQSRAEAALKKAGQQQKELLSGLTPERWDNPEQFVNALNSFKKQKGHLLTLQDTRYINEEHLAELNKKVDETIDKISQATIAFISKDESLTPYQQRLETFEDAITSAEDSKSLKVIQDDIEQTAEGLDLLTTILSTLDVEDAPERTLILEKVAEIYAQINQVKAKSRNKLKSIKATESIAEFGAQFKLFSLSITNAVSVCDTPERCDEELTKLTVQLEEIESQFADNEQYLGEILNKREELYDTFQNLKQTLLDERQRRAQHLYESAIRVLKSIERRSQSFSSVDDLNTYFASDAMVLKIQSFSDQLITLSESVKADDIQSHLKGIKDQAIKSLRDKSEIYSDQGKTLKLGKHLFNVNTQQLDTSLIHKDNQLYIHLSGTNFYQLIDNEELANLNDYWKQTILSENQYVYRAEYLAYQIIKTAENQQQGWSIAKLQELKYDNEQLIKAIREYMTPRYQEGYQKGIHDHDCAKILTAYLTSLETQGLLKYSGLSRCCAAYFWISVQGNSSQVNVLSGKAQGAFLLANQMGESKALNALTHELEDYLKAFYHEKSPSLVIDFTSTAKYLIEVLAVSPTQFMVSVQGQQLAEQFEKTLHNLNYYNIFEKTLRELSDNFQSQWELLQHWLSALSKEIPENILNTVIADAVTVILTNKKLSLKALSLPESNSIPGLLGDHPRIQQSELTFSLAEFNNRLQHFTHTDTVNFEKLVSIKQKLLEKERKRLRLDDFTPKPLTSFVRNKLINDVYFKIIGDNLAKQMGAAGNQKRSDLMGLLLLISPPGYGKTTLMEYIANRLGLVFVKVNCPSLGHQVISLDPEEAPNATARQELIKLNLSFEMGNNVMLYLDDIQHTHPEFLQKFISLCDGTRRVEGVWDGETKTYDLRGKKFCIAMAGNPYTESGEVFKIPDMLANRADIYNLGDILSGSEETFELSYIENSLTSNSVLAPLATRNLADVYHLINMAKGKQSTNGQLEYDYSSAELEEILSVIRKLLYIQEFVLKVNQAYIKSAATADAYRTEPPFKLQGSYRNMNKMAEKVVAIMNDEELNNLILDHYVGEAQTLTFGAEENLLKLKEIMQFLTEEESVRWQKIKDEFSKRIALGGDEQDTLAKIAYQIASLNQGLTGIEKSLSHSTSTQTWSEHLTHFQQTVRQTLGQQQKQSLAASKMLQHQLGNINNAMAMIGENLVESSHGLQHITALSEACQQIQKSLETIDFSINVVNQPSPVLEQSLSALANTVESSLMPVVTTMNHKIGLDQNILRKVNELSDQLKAISDRQ